MANAILKTRFNTSFLVSICITVVVSVLPWSVRADLRYLGPENANVTEIACSPVDSNLVFLGTKYGGIYRSLDAGQTWESMNETYPARFDSTTEWDDAWGGVFIPITVIRTHPSDASIVYVGGGDDGNSFLAMSADTGRTWQTIGEEIPPCECITDLWIHPEHPDTMFTCTQYPGGLFKSINGGMDWQLDTTMVHNDHYIFECISSNETEPDVLYVGFGSDGCVPYPHWGVFRTLDCGQSWELVQDFYDTSHRVRNVIVDRNDSHHAWIVYWGFEYYGIPLETFDAGSTWAYGQWGIGQINNAYINSFNRITLYSEEGLLISDDLGENWTGIGTDLPWVFGQSALCTSWHNPQRLYSGSYLGPFISVDGGVSSVRSVSGLENARISSVSRSESAITVAGGQSGIWISRADSAWTHCYTNDMINRVLVDSQNPDFIYAATNYSFLVSQDRGMTWNASTINGLIGMTFLYELPIGNDSTVLLCGGAHNGGYLARSTNNGFSWSMVNVGVIGLPTHIVSDPNHEDLIYLSHHGISRSYDNGETWERCRASTRVYGMDIDRNSKLYFSTIQGLFYTRNEGHNFYNVPIDPTLPIERILDIEIVGSEEEDLIYIATNDGIYYSEDRCASWIYVEGTREIKPNSIEWDRQNGCFLIASNNHGVWELDLRTNHVNIDRKPALPTASLVGYPNPFNSSLHVQMALPNAGYVHAVVYDITGRQVATLADGVFAAGYRELSWNANGLASGVYIVRMEAQGETCMMKVMLIK